jgi:selenocysteine lyase/cysteine desulfurase
MLTLARARVERSFADIRRSEFARLDAQGLAYLDYTGSALYGETQIRTHHALLSKGIFGNPHSENAPSRQSAQIIDSARDRVLQFLGVDSSTHDVCFTANTTAAIKLVAESYPFAPDAPLILSADNHNSVNGIREYARAAGAPVRYIALDGEMRLRDPESVLAEEAWRGRGLLAYPAQSNFSGVRHPLSLVARAKSLGYDVLLDIAAYAPTRRISLRECPADFAALSFYKLFGYPTGLGALVVRREALARLRRPWFSGGTLLYASVQAGTHRLKARHEAFEDGTQNFLAIAALAAGFALLDDVGMPRLSAHVARLTGCFLERIASRDHIRVYGPTDMTDRGGAVAFNVADVPYWVIEACAARERIAVRGGCFCNPGASEAAFGLDPAECLDSLGDTFTPQRFADCSGTAVGAIRVSFGLANNDDDVQRAVTLVETFA